MSLADTLQNDMKQALKAKDELKLSTIRLLLSSVSYARIEKGGELTDEEVLAVVSRAAKQRRESVEAANNANRSDIAEREGAELEIISFYLPKQLTQDEVEQIAREIIAQLGVTDLKDRGKVMGPLMQKIKGRADGKIAGVVVEKLLRTG